MRRSQRLLPTAMILLTLPLLWIFASPYFGMAQKVGRSGKFTLLGTLTYVDGEPVVGKDVEILEVDKKDRVLFKVAPDGTFKGSAAYGKTDYNGRFRVEVNRSYFDVDRIRFTIQVRLSKGGGLEDVRDKRGIFVIFEV
ncbi:MAG: hypothetical protein NTX30_20360, partial [Deltaproteobacteria bacterium]|nr:hypothetical protein [Deltaproteobacteria bacterium]